MLNNKLAGIKTILWCQDEDPLANWQKSSRAFVFLIPSLKRAREANLRPRHPVERAGDNGRGRQDNAPRNTAQPQKEARNQVPVPRADYQKCNPRLTPLTLLVKEILQHLI